MPRDVLTTRDYPHSVGRGDVDGATQIGAYGKRVETTTVSTPQLLWPNGAWAVPPAVGITAEVVSTSAEDTNLTGTGIWTIEMHYLDADLNEQIGYVTMNGLTPAPVLDGLGSPVTDLRFVQCMHMSTYGTSKAAVGNITLREVGQTQPYSYISAGTNRCSSSARMVPKGKVLYVQGAYAGSVSATADAAAIVDIGTSYFEGHQYAQDAIIIPFGSIATQTTSLSYTFPIASPIPEGSIVAMVYTIDKAGTVVGGWFGHLENAQP